MFTMSLILWIVWIHLKKTEQVRTIANNDYHRLQSDI